MPTLNTETNYQILSTFIEASQGADYATNIPELTRTNITSVGNAIMNYTASRDMFYESFIVKIVLQLFNSLVATNKFSFLKGMVVDGDIEDAYVDYIQGKNFDPTDENPFAISKADIKTLYHRVDRRLLYETTISDQQLRQAFLSDNGLSMLINRVINTLYMSKEWDEYTMVKQLIVDNYAHAGKVVTISGDPLVKVSNLLYELKKASKDISYVTRDYNEFGVANNTPKEEQILVLHKDYALNIDMSVLANTFNMDKLALETQLVEVDNFNTNDDKIIAVIMDRRGFRIHDALREMRTQINGKALYTNYFLHVWQIMSYAYFMQSVYFIEETATEEIGTPEEFNDTVTIYEHPALVTGYGTINLTSEQKAIIESLIAFREVANNESYALYVNVANLMENHTTPLSLTPVSANFAPFDETSLTSMLCEDGGAGGFYLWYEYSPSNLLVCQYNADITGIGTYKLTMKWVKE